MQEEDQHPAGADRGDDELRPALLLALGLQDTAAPSLLQDLTLAAAAVTGCEIAAFVMPDTGPPRVTSWHGAPREAAAALAAPLSQVLQAGGFIEIGTGAEAPADGCYCAGAPLRVEGLVVGALCVADRHPRPPLDGRARDALRGLIGVAEALLAARRPGAENEARALQHRQQLLSRVSHEMRTPLNAMLGFAQLLGTLPVLDGDARARHWVGQIEKAARQLLEMVEEMLLLARLEARRPSAPRRRVDLAETLRDCLELLAARAAGREVSLVLHGDGSRSEWPVAADARALRQILVNLIDNAIRHSPRGGQVVLQLQALGARLGVAVSDSGPGLPAAALERLRSGDVEGGLAISRRLAAALRGAIDVQSTPGTGSTFRLQLPLAGPPRERQLPPAPQGDPPMSMNIVPPPIPDVLPQPEPPAPPPQPPEIIEPTDPAEIEPVREPIVPGDARVLPS